MSPLFNVAESYSRLITDPRSRSNTDRVVSATWPWVEQNTRQGQNKRLLLRPATTLLQSSAQLSGSPLWSSGTLPVRTYTPRLSIPTLVSRPPGHVGETKQCCVSTQTTDSRALRNRCTDFFYIYPCIDTFWALDPCAIR